MLKDYLVVAQEALSAQKEIYQVKQQRLELAQQEYQQLHAVWEHKLGSQVSCEYLPPLAPAALAGGGHTDAALLLPSTCDTCPLFSTSAPHPDQQLLSAVCSCCALQMIHFPFVFESILLASGSIPECQLCSVSVRLKPAHLGKIEVLCNGSISV